MVFIWLLLCYKNTKPERHQMNKQQKVRVGISIGDLNGIGAEIVIKTFSEAMMLDFCTPVIFASAKTLSYIKKELGLQAEFYGIDAFAKAGGICTIIPNSTTSPNAYNLTLQNLASLQVTAKQNEKQLVTTINYDHPIYRDVFDTRIDNFQYPSVSESYAIAGGDPILKFQDGSTFLTAQNGIYAFSGSLSQENSNFKSSPLIVPTFYNMARQSLQLPDLYMNTGVTNTYDIPLVLQDDEVITLEQSTAQENNFIPLQQSKGSRVQITTTQRPEVAGNYNVQYGTNTIQQVSYNYTRSESNLRYAQLDNDKNYYTSIKSLFDKFESSDNVQSLWKWFIIFALLFLLLEILILKFYK